MRDIVRQPDALAVRLRAGDASALEELFERDGGPAFRLAYRVLRDAAAAEDAVQEAFAQLWERAPGLNTSGSLRSLLMTIVHRRALDQVRSRRRAPATPVDTEALSRVDEQAAEVLERIIEQVSSEGLRRRLHAALLALPPEQRAVIELGHGAGLTLPEIAAREGVALGTVKSRLRLAMGKLSLALKDEARP
ncbi:MAG: RNA polymerase sigma factor [Dehalococcoidia bacterium]